MRVNHAPDDPEGDPDRPMLTPLRALAIGLAPLAVLPGTAASASPGTVFACREESGAGLRLRPAGDPLVHPERCSPVALPLALDGVRWAAWLPGLGDPGSRLTVEGPRKDGAFAPGAIARVQASPARGTPQRAPIPVGQPLLGLMAAKPFGVEERATVTRTDEAVTLRCRPGARPAGLVLDPGQRRFPAGARVETLWQASGDAGFTAGLTPEGQALDRAQALAPGTPLASEPAGDPQARERPWFVVQCPEGAAALTVTDLRLQPAAGTPRGPAVSAWAWSPALWREDGARLVARARAIGADRVFISVVVEEGRVAQAQTLAAFVAAAGAAGIGVAAVEGDPGMALEAGRREALERLSAIVRYQQAAPPAGRLAGVQYDIEPYLLPAYATEPERVRGGWAETILALQQAAGGLALDLVLPFWIAGDEGAAAMVLPAVARAAERVTVMAYRTTGAAIQSAAEPLLGWGAQAGVPIHVALEAGPLDDEATRHYREAERGDLQLVRQADGRYLAVLLDAPQAPVDGARAYALSHEVPAPAHRVSFLGDEARLMREAEAAARAFRAWPSFAGLAYHGLIE